MAGSQPVLQGLLPFNTRQKRQERLRQQIQDLRAKHERLRAELEDTKRRLMMDPGKWTGEFEVNQDLDNESTEYLESLARVTNELEYCVKLCKSRLMMETCFDIEILSNGQGTSQRAEV